MFYFYPYQGKIISLYILIGLKPSTRQLLEFFYSRWYFYFEVGSRWYFSPWVVATQRFFMFTPKIGEMIQFWLICYICFKWAETTNQFLPSWGRFFLNISKIGCVFFFLYVTLLVGLFEGQGGENIRLEVVPRLTVFKSSLHTAS